MKKPKQTLKAINKQGNNGANLSYTNTFVVHEKNIRKKNKKTLQIIQNSYDQGVYILELIVYELWLF